MQAHQTWGWGSHIGMKYIMWLPFGCFSGNLVYRLGCFHQREICPNFQVKNWVLFYWKWYTDGCVIGQKLIFLNLSWHIHIHFWWEYPPPANIIYQLLSISHYWINQATSWSRNGRFTVFLPNMDMSHIRGISVLWRCHDPFSNQPFTKKTQGDSLVLVEEMWFRKIYEKITWLDNVCG